MTAQRRGRLRKWSYKRAATTRPRKVAAHRETPTQRAARVASIIADARRVVVLLPPHPANEAIVDRLGRLERAG